MADYAVVILAFMSETREERLSAAQIAQYTSLPEPTVAKVLKMLTKGGLVESVRGASGGYSLKSKAQEIGMLDVITAIDGPLALTDCTKEGEKCCDLEETCTIKGKWNPVNAAVSQALSNVTLADMVK